MPASPSFPAMFNADDSATHYRAVFDAVDEGVCIIDMLFDEQGEACDYRFLETNPAFDELTGWGGEQDRAQSLAAGFDLHLTKPVNKAALDALLADPARLRLPAS
jgi:PAS domain-containing protein